MPPSPMQVTVEYQIIEIIELLLAVGDGDLGRVEVLGGVVKHLYIGE